MKSEKIFFLLFAIPVIVLGKTIRLNVKDNPKLDYDFHEEESEDTPKPLTISSTPISQTFKSNELEIEENIIDSGYTEKQDINLTIADKPTESINYNTVPTAQNVPVPMCSMDVDKFNLKISKLMEKFVPAQLKLKPIIRGAMAKVHLLNGKLMINKDYKISGNPYCIEKDDNTKEYEIMVSFNNLMGSFEWKIFNLFGYNFSENALLTIKQIMTELVIVENSRQRTKLKDIKVGKIEGLSVNVNIPKQITSINFFKPMLEYVVSRITTIIANGSTDTIVKNMRDSFLDSINDKIKINP